MRVKHSVIVALAVGLLAAGPAAGVIGSLDPVPAATLLLPYFEVDLVNPLGAMTLVSVGNAEPTPVIVHVTLWSDLSVPTLDWNMYLTGYDLVTINLRDLFVLGLVPQTEHANDGDSISPVGIFSAVTDPATGVGPGSTSCNGQLPLPSLPPVLLDHIRAAHTGAASPIVYGGLCAGVDHGDGVARGYITFDSVSYCSLDFPGDTGYFIDGGNGAANDKNALLGDFAILNTSTGTGFAETLVHLEADPSLDASDYTFYRRYSGGADDREPLGTTFWARYKTPGTRLLAWRDSKRSIFPFSCALVAPAPYPLGQSQVVIFDEQENPEVPESSPFSPAIPGLGILPFAWEAGITQVGGSDLPSPFTAGWLYLNLNSFVAGSQVPFEPAMQNYMATVHEQAGVDLVGGRAFQLDNALDYSDVLLPICDGAPDPPACF